MEKEGPERKILKEIMAKKCPSPLNTYKPTDPRSPVKSSIGNIRRITPRHHCQTAQSQRYRNLQNQPEGEKDAALEDKGDISFVTGALATQHWSPLPPASGGPSLASRRISPLLCKSSVPTTQAEHRYPASHPDTALSPQGSDEPTGPEKRPQPRL